MNSPRKPVNHHRTRLIPITTCSKIARQIFEEIERQGRTYKEVFSAVGFARTNAHEWKNGKSTPRLLSVEEIADVLGREFVLVDQKRKDAELVSRLVHDLIPPMTETGDLSLRHKANAFDAVRRALYGPGPKEI